MKINDRIKQTRKRLGYSQEILGTRVGVSRVSISQWERGENTPNGRYINDLAGTLGVTVDWLLTGSGAMSGQPTASPITGSHVVAPAVLPTGAQVPVLSYAQAGNWRAVCEQARPLDGQIEYVTAGGEIGPYGFGLWLRSDAMLPQFKEGDLIIVDPDEAPQPGDFVVASKDNEEITFKKYRPRGIDENGQEVFELVPLNDDFPTLHSDRQHIQIIGVMVEHRTFRKRKIGS